MNTTIFNYLQNILPIELASKIRLFASNRLQDTLKNDIVNFHFRIKCCICLSNTCITNHFPWHRIRIIPFERFEPSNRIIHIAISRRSNKSLSSEKYKNIVNEFIHKRNQDIIKQKQKKKKKIDKQLYSSSKQLHISFTNKRNISKNHTRKEAKRYR